jgi:KaiC/GvpD/RAD55 family RecA-like ATPase
MSSVTQAQPLIGRERELAEIAHALDGVASGRGRLVALVGEPGVGKTRLADEAAASAAARGVLVVWGRCWESGGAPPYWPWLDVLDGLCRALPDGPLGDALGDGAALIAELVPAVRARMAASAPGMAPPTPAEARFRLWRAVAALVRRAAATAGGLLIVLDDLHAADESSLLLLHFLARELRPTRALVLATYRDVEARLDPAAGEVLARVAREGTTLSLQRLDRDASAHFLRVHAGAVEPAVAERIFASALGNPLFLGEMTRLYAETGADAITGGALPHGVRDVIRQRLDRLSDQARPLLELAAVAGDELDPALLAAASGRARAEVDASLAAAARVGVLVDRGASRMRFFHALVREVLYRDVDAERRRGLHAELGAALARLSEHEAAPPLAELAHHALSGPPAGIAAAVGFALRAAARSLDLLAYEDALALLARAADAVRAAGDLPELQARVTLALGRARIRRGDLTEGRALCLEAAALARRAGAAELIAEAALAYGEVFTPALVDPALVGLIEEALGLLPPGDSRLRVRLLARLAAALTPAVRSSEPVSVAREAIASARRLGDPGTLLGALYAGMSAFMDIVDGRERLPLNLEIEQLAGALGDRERLLRTQARLVVDHVELGDWAAAEARTRAFEALARELRAPWALWRVPLFRSMIAIVTGRFADAERLVAEAEEPARATPDPEAARCWVMHREGLLRAWERHDEMAAFEVESVRARAALIRAAGWQSTIAALIPARAEDEERTRLHLTQVPPDMMPPFDNPYGMFFAAEAAALVGEPEVVARLIDLLRPHAERNVIMGLTALLWEGPVSRLLALLAARLGRWDEATAQFETALARLERLGARPYLARTRYEQGRALLARGRADDRTQARALIGGALEEAEALGQSGLVRLARARLAALGDAAPAPAPAPAAHESFRLQAEGEYWTITHAGAAFRLKDSLGLRYLARLVAEPDREVHVLDLVGKGEEGAADGGDAGELLDAEARESYRRRLEDLCETVDEAESFGDAARAARAREEMEALTAELGRAVGLGGRARRAGGAAERARSAVQRRLRNALDRIAERAPPLAQHLSARLRTGTYCVYRSKP